MQRIVTILTVQSGGRDVIKSLILSVFNAEVAGSANSAAQYT